MGGHVPNESELALSLLTHPLQHRAGREFSSPNAHINPVRSMARRRRCPVCKSRQWRKEPSSGVITCSEGHVLMVRTEARSNINMHFSFVILVSKALRKEYGVQQGNDV